MKNQKLLVGALVVQSAMIIGLWYGPRASTARAEIPDSGGQLLQVNQALTATNQKLDHIIALFDSGKLQVHLVKDDDK
jgi:hypothetical protein